MRYVLEGRGSKGKIAITIDPSRASSLARQKADWGRQRPRTGGTVGLLWVAQARGDWEKVREAKMLEIRELTKRYGNVVALDGASSSVAPGRIVGFLGPNEQRSHRRARS
jgi:hypothetical protein